MKRYTVLALVMVLCASMLVGCGCSSNVGVTTEPTTRPTSAPTTVPTTAPTTQPTTRPTTAPTTAPDTSPTDTTGIMDDILGTEDNMDMDRGTIPNAGTEGTNGRRMR